MEHFLTPDILSTIGEYLNNVKDYIHLFQINKFVYNNILNDNETILRNEIFKKEVIICLNEKLPSYLFKLQNLNITQENNDFNLLNKFKYLKYLEIQKLPKDFIFPNLSFLEELKIKNSNLQSSTLVNLQQKLKILNIARCTIKDDCLNYLNNLQELIVKLIKLHFEHSIKKDDFTKNIENIINLKHLTIHNYYPNYNSNFLEKLTNLEYLSIDLENINEENFKNLTKLTTLDISGTILPEENNCFTNLVNLTELTVGDCINFNGKCLLNFTNLEKLNISKNEKLTDDSFKNLKNLRRLNIRNCQNLNGECFQYLNKLEDLHFTDLNISDKYLQNLTNLKYLSFTQCPSLSEPLVNLTLVDIHSSPQLLKKGDYLLNMDKLNRLKLHDLNLKTKKGINSLKERIRNGEALEQTLIVQTK
ncbi:hypothetical protein ABK040_012930 [Willaertia magna]